MWVKNCGGWYVLEENYIMKNHVNVPTLQNIPKFHTFWNVTFYTTHPGLPHILSGLYCTFIIVVGGCWGASTKNFRLQRLGNLWIEGGIGRLHSRLWSRPLLRLFWTEFPEHTRAFTISTSLPETLAASSPSGLWASHVTILSTFSMFEMTASCFKPSENPTTTIALQQPSSLPRPQTNEDRWTVRHKQMVRPS